jgi:hypothetical protein
MGKPSNSRERRRVCSRLSGGETTTRARSRKSKLYLNSGGSSSRAASTGPLPSKSKANGLKPKSAPSSVAGHKRRRSDEEDEDSMFDSDDEDDDDDVPPTKRRAMGGSVLARFGLNLNQREYHDMTTTT